MHQASGSFIAGEIDPLQPPVSAFSGIFIVCNAALGVGTLSFPSAFARSGGLPFSIPILLLCAVICGVALLICAWGCHEANTMEYFGAVGYFCGKLAVICFHVGLTFSNIGTCILYMIIVGDQSDEVLYKFAGREKFCDDDKYWYLQRYFTMTILNVFIVFPLCLAKNVDFLKYPSSIGVVSMVYLMIVVVIDYFLNDHTDAIIETKPNSFADIFNAFPTILLGYQCMTNACPVFGCLKNKSKVNYVILVAGSMFLCTVVYLPIGTFGYLSNGKNVKGNVLKSYSSNDVKILIAQIAVLIAVMMSYPVMYFISRPCIDELWVNARKLLNKNYDETKHATLRRYVIVVTFFVGTLAAALGIPDVTVAVDFTGSIASFFCVVFPGLFLIQTTYIINGKRLQNSTNNDLTDLPDPGESYSLMSVTEEHRKKKEFEPVPQKDLELEGSSGNRKPKLSYFEANKSAKGGLTWILRIVGGIFVTVGVFLFGQGFVQAVQSVNTASSDSGKC